MKHYVIIVPGLFSTLFKRETFFKKIADELERRNLNTEIFFIDWFSRKETFSYYLTKLKEKIDYLTANNNYVSLIGTSAGGSIVINALSLDNTKIHRVVLICCPLNSESLRRYKLVGFASKIFKESLSQCEKQINVLTKSEKEKILLFIPSFDELVPASTMELSGAKFLITRTKEHFISVNSALTKDLNQICSHLKNISLNS